MATCAPVNRTLAGDLAPSAIIRELIFDDRAINVAFVVYHDNACTLFLPGGEIVRYDMVEHAITDRNGKAVAYKAYHKGERFVGVNARRDSSFTWVGDPRVAPDGGTVAYFAERPVRGGFGAAEYLLVIDGEVKDSYHEPGNIVFTPRGQLVFTVQDKRDSIVSIGGEVLGRFAAVSPPVVAPGTGDVFFWVRQNDRWCLYSPRLPCSCRVTSRTGIPDGR